MGSKEGPPVWDLSSLVESEDPDEVKKAMDKCLRAAEEFEEKYKGRIKDLSPSEICEMYRELDALQMRFYHLRNYAFLRQSQDTRNDTANDLVEYSMKIGAALGSRVIFCEIEIARVLADRPEIVDDSALDEYRHALEKARDRGRFLLEEKDEKLIMEKDLYGIDSWSELHRKLRSTLKYRAVIGGKEQEMVFSELQTIFEGNPDRELRRAAAKAYYEGVSRDLLGYATALRCIFGDHLSQVRLRGQLSVLTESLLYNDITQSTLDALISSMKRRTPLIRRYLNARAQAMGLTKLAGCDLSPIRIAPIAEAQGNIPWSEAKRLVIESFTEFDKESGEFVASLFEQKRIDASIRSGKDASGFCMYFPALRTSYVMMGYGGALNEVSTLAHESGHGLHAYYASEKHKSINFDPGNCLAETGSIFGEMLLADKLLRESQDEDARLVVLDKVLSGLYLMVFYMLNDYLFEHSVFTTMERNEAINTDRLDSLWLAARTEVFGDSVEWLPGMEHWWVVPVHHFLPRFRFYNYPYSFAQLLALVLYQRYREEGASFVPKMKRILSAGGSESPQILLAEIGLDLTDPGFWDTGFELAESYLDQFEQLMKGRTR